jgi:pyruvate/2-oxoglutarate/acetoin dehydrogenase E1 component
MAPKPGNYAVLEAVQQEMRNDPHLTLLYEYQRPTAVSPTGQVIDLYKEFGPIRVPDWGPLDEEWFVGGAMGAAMTGVRSIAHLPSMTTLRCYELVFNQIGKLRHMTGGQARGWTLRAKAREASRYGLRCPGPSKGRPSRGGS